MIIFSLLLFIFRIEIQKLPRFFKDSRCSALAQSLCACALQTAESITELFFPFLEVYFSQNRKLKILTKKVKNTKYKGTKYLQNSKKIKKGENEIQKLKKKFYGVIGNNRK